MPCERKGDVAEAEKHEDPTHRAERRVDNRRALVTRRNDEENPDAKDQRQEEADASHRRQRAIKRVLVRNHRNSVSRSQGQKSSKYDERREARWAGIHGDHEETGDTAEQCQRYPVHPVSLPAVFDDPENVGVRCVHDCAPACLRKGDASSLSSLWAGTFDGRCHAATD